MDGERERNEPLLCGGEVVVANAYREGRVARTGRREEEGKLSERDRDPRADPFVLGGRFVSGLRAYEVFTFICSNYTTGSRGNGWQRDERGKGQGGLASANWSETTKTGAWMSVNLRAVLLISN